MLKLIGNKGKSYIVDAVQQLYNARIYSYDKNLPLQTDCYHVDVDECCVEDFCKFVYDDIRKLEHKLPIRMVVIYTNLSDMEEIELIDECADKLEKENLVTMVLVISRN